MALRVQRSPITALEDRAIRSTVRSVDKPDWIGSLDEPIDVALVAGGDGTVGEAAPSLPDRAMPIAIVVAGTAKNIARSLGLGEPPPDVAALLQGTGLGALVRATMVAAERAARLASTDRMQLPGRSCAIG